MGVLFLMFERRLWSRIAVPYGTPTPSYHWQTPPHGPGSMLWGSYHDCARYTSKHVAEGHIQGVGRKGVGRKARQYERRTLAGTHHTAKRRLRRQALFCCVPHSCGLRGSHLSDALISPISGSANRRPSINPAHELLPDRADTSCTMPSDKCSTWPAHPRISCFRCRCAYLDHRRRTR
jgi:hypothetical protein